jgi:hypothetical protein
VDRRYQADESASEIGPRAVSCMTAVRQPFNEPRAVCNADGDGGRGPTSGRQKGASALIRVRIQTGKIVGLGVS